MWASCGNGDGIDQVFSKFEAGRLSSNQRRQAPTRIVLNHSTLRFEFPLSFLHASPGRREVSYALLAFRQGLASKPPRRKARRQRRVRERGSGFVEGEVFNCRVPGGGSEALGKLWQATAVADMAADTSHLASAADPLTEVRHLCVHSSALNKSAGLLDGFHWQQGGSQGIQIVTLEGGEQEVQDALERWALGWRGLGGQELKQQGLEGVPALIFVLAKLYVSSGYLIASHCEGMSKSGPDLFPLEGGPLEKGEWLVELLCRGRLRTFSNPLAQRSSAKWSVSQSPPLFGIPASCTEGS